MRLLFGRLVEVGVVGLDLGAGPPHHEEHESEQLKDGVSLEQRVLLDELLSEGGFDLFEDLAAEDEVHGGLRDGEDVLL